MFLFQLANVIMTSLTGAEGHVSKNTHAQEEGQGFGVTLMVDPSVLMLVQAPVAHPGIGLVMVVHNLQP